MTPDRTRGEQPLPARSHVPVLFPGDRVWVNSEQIEWKDQVCACCLCRHKLQTINASQDWSIMCPHRVVSATWTSPSQSKQSDKWTRLHHCWCWNNPWRRKHVSKCDWVMDQWLYTHLAIDYDVSYLTKPLVLNVIFWNG